MTTSLLPLHVAVGLLFAAAGMYVLLGAPRRPLNRALAAFLLLWGGSSIVFQMMREAPTLEAYAWYVRVGSIYELATPLLLLFIADELFLPQPRSRARKAGFVVGTALTAVAFLAYFQTYTHLPFVVDDPLAQTPFDPGKTALPHLHGAAMFTAQGLLVWLGGRAAADPARSTLQRRQAGLVALALSVLLAHTGSLAIRTLHSQYVLGPTVGNEPQLFASAAMVPWLAALLAFAAVLWAVPRALRVFDARWHWPALAMLAFAFWEGLPVVWPQGVHRWIVLTPFALLLALAVLRYDIAGIGRARRARTERASTALLVVGVAGVAAGLWLSFSGTTLPGIAVAAAIVAVPAAATLGPGDRLRRGLEIRILPDPADPEVVRERVRIYASALEGALVGGQSVGTVPTLPDHALPALKALRGELGLSDRDHALLLGMVTERQEARRLVSYRLALEDATLGAAGGATSAPVDPASLDALREAYGISAREHELLLADVRAGDAARDPEPGDLVLGRYRVVRALGRGGFGEVLLARDEREGRDVVLKRMVGDEARGAEAFKRMRREVRMATALEHPRVVTVHGIAEGPSAAYIVMEHVKGGSLADRLRERGPLDVEEARRIALDVLEALAALHGAGIVHRDVKPGNILLTSTGEGARAKLGDFTVAHEVVSGETVGASGPGGPVGTYAYMAPEQVRGLQAVPASDLYGLGATLVEAMTGRTPIPVEGLTTFEAADRILSQPPQVPGADAVGEGVRTLLAKALAKDPADRFQDAAAMAAALAGLERTGTPSPTGPVPAPTPSRAGTPAGSAPRPPRRPG